MPVGGSCLCSPGAGQGQGHWGKGTWSAVACRAPCSWLSLCPAPGSQWPTRARDCPACCVVSVDNWCVCLCVCARVCAEANIEVFGECFRKIAGSRLPGFAYMFLFLSFLLRTHVIGILERFGFSYPNCSLSQWRLHNSPPIILSNK